MPGRGVRRPCQWSNRLISSHRLTPQALSPAGTEAGGPAGFWHKQRRTRLTACHSDAGIPPERLCSQSGNGPLVRKPIKRTDSTPHPDPAMVPDAQLPEERTALSTHASVPRTQPTAAGTAVIAVCDPNQREDKRQTVCSQPEQDGHQPHRRAFQFQRPQRCQR